MTFVRFLKSGFKTEMDLPPCFCTEAIGDYLVEVVTCLGRWVLEVRNDNGRFYVHGDKWARFVNNHELDEGGLLLFEHLDSFIFHATVFDSSGCEKSEFQPIR
ncbi:hypothetical protein ACS0TY_030052 [Phlomoides rotata]